MNRVVSYFIIINIVCFYFVTTTLKNNKCILFAQIKVATLNINSERISNRGRSRNSSSGNFS